jgi:hypothetical protein
VCPSDFDAAGDAKVLGQAAPVLPVKAGGVGLIHHQPGAELLFERNHFPERGVVAVHAEDGFGD